MNADRQEQPRQAAEVKAVVWSMEEPEIAAPPPPVPRGWQPQADEEAPARSLPAGIEEDSTHAFIYRHRREAAAVLRTIIQRDEQGAQDGPLAGMSARQLVAAAMAGLGQGVAVEVLGQMGSEVVESVAAAIIGEPPVTHQVATHAIDMVRERIVAGNYLEDGGPGYARSLMMAYTWRGRALSILHRAGGVDEPVFERMSRLPTEQIVPFLRHEHPQTIALILTKLKPAQATDVLSQLPQATQPDVAYRIATMDAVAPAIVEEIEEYLSTNLSEILLAESSFGGPQSLAELLSGASSPVEENVLRHIHELDAALGEEVRGLMPGAPAGEEAEDG